MLFKLLRFNCVFSFYPHVNPRHIAEECVAINIQTKELLDAFLIIIIINIIITVLIIYNVYFNFML